MTICGLMLAVPLVTMGLFWWDSLGYMIDFNFERVERGDAQVTLFQPLPTRSVREILRIPGVIAVEGSRLVSVRLINGHRSYRTVLQGLSERSELRVPRESDYRPVEIPPDGVVLSRRLATRLSVSVGDMLTIEIQEGARQLRQVAIAGLADDILGLSAYIARPAVNRLMREGDLVNSVALRIDPRAAPDVWSKLQQIAKVEAVAIRASLLRTFDEKISGLINISAMILTSFGVLIAFGVVYNAARVAYQERAWELATLRILGFTRREIAFVLFGELVVVVAIALPLGLILAHQLIGLILRLRDNESFQLPAIISPATFAISALVIVVASVASTILVRRMVDRLDLVAVLKTRD
jgi:putative ABC transport system permease protein